MVTLLWPLWPWFYTIFMLPYLKQQLCTQNSLLFSIQTNCHLWPEPRPNLWRCLLSCWVHTAYSPRLTLHYCVYLFRLLAMPEIQYVRTMIRLEFPLKAGSLLAGSNFFIECSVFQSVVFPNWADLLHANHEWYFKTQSGISVSVAVNYYNYYSL